MVFVTHTEKKKVYLIYSQRIIVAGKSVHCAEDLKKKEDCSISSGNNPARIKEKQLCCANSMYSLHFHKLGSTVK